MPPPEVPPDLADLARQLRLGEVQFRFGYRPHVITAIVVITAAIFDGAAFVGALVSGALGACALSLPVLAVAGWWVHRTRVRARGGVYVFEGGIAEAYAGKVVKIFSWTEIRALQRRTVYLIGFLPLPFFVDREWVLFAYREDVAEIDGMVVRGTLIDREVLLAIVEARADVG